MQPSVDKYLGAVDRDKTHYLVKFRWEGGAYMNVSDRIRELRKIKGISQDELAEKLGVTRQAI